LPVEPLAPVSQGQASKTQIKRAIDARLKDFLDKSQTYFEKTVETVPAALQEKIEPPKVADEIKPAGELEGAETSKAVQPATLPVEAEPPVELDLKQSYRRAVELSATAALGLAHLAQHFSTAWPHAVRYSLPSNEPNVSTEQTWGPVLAWIVLSSVPRAEARAALFDELQLRSALAEIFSSMGLEGDKTWRLAAQVKVLLSWAGVDAVRSTGFWGDHDVQWLTGMNESEGKTYFNKEQFEELLCWLQLPALLEIKVGSHELLAVEANVSTVSRDARIAGYDLEKFLGISKVVESPEALVGAAVLTSGASSEKTPKEKTATEKL
jgi:hypothetical protein